MRSDASSGGSTVTISPNISHDPTTRAWVDVDLGAVVANARTIAAVSGARLMPIVKANGYGLGAVEVTRALAAVDPWGVGVSTPEEGAELRDAGFDGCIFVVSPLVPAWVDAMLVHRLRPLIGDFAALDAWTSRSDGVFHVDIDTGMSRSGFRWTDHDAIATLAARLATSIGAAWEGVATHFHSADVPSSDATERQWERFEAVLAELPRRPSLVHAANSAAAACGRRYAGDLIRPGIFLYGAGGGAVRPMPVAAFRARVVSLRPVAAGESVSYGATWQAERPTTIATIAAGYADGVLRAAEEGQVARPARVVELGGEVVPVVGRVTMDMIMVAAPPGVRIGDVATIYGGLVSLEQQAAASGTIPYELLTALGRRVARRYQGT